MLKISNLSFLERYAQISDRDAKTDLIVLVYLAWRRRLDEQVRRARHGTAHCGPPVRFDGYLVLHPEYQGHED